LEKDAMSSAINPHNLPEEAVKVAIKDKSNPTSLINLSPSSLASRIGAIPDELFEARPDELAEKFRKERRDKNGKLIYNKETEIEEKLRISFWREYDRAAGRGHPMNMERICSGVCHIQQFQKVITNSYRLAYICTPPDDYVTTMQELLTIGLDQLRDIILLPHVDDKGAPITRMCDVKMKIIDNVLTRVKGAVTQRVETKNLNLNVEQTNVGPSDIASVTDPNEIDRRLKELLSSDSSSETIDVTPKS
jgi:hypothetical protein